MNQSVASVKCLSVIAQVTMGYYDEDGNLVHEELFPQVDGNVLTAKLFYPQTEQLAQLIHTCTEQAGLKLRAQEGPATLEAPNRNGALDTLPAAASLPTDAAGRDRR